MREDFIGFTNITGNTTGQHISDVIIAYLESIDLNPSNIRAQAYDGTGNWALLFIYEILWVIYLFVHFYYNNKQAI